MPCLLVACIAALVSAVAVFTIVLLLPQHDDLPNVAFRSSGEGVHATPGSRQDWVEQGDADKEAAVTVTFSVKQSNEDLAHEMLLNVSTPRHPMRHKFLSPAALRELIAAPDSTAAVRAWLNRLGATRVRERHFGLRVQAVASVATWERALNVTFGHFVRAGRSGAAMSTPARGDAVLRAKGPPFVPVAIAPHVSGIHGVSSLPPRRQVHDPLKRNAGGVPPMVASDAPPPTAVGATSGSGRRLDAAWLQAEGCPLDPCETSGLLRRRRLQTFDGTNAQAHVCCQGAADSDGRRLQTFDGTNAQAHICCQAPASGARRLQTFNGDNAQGCAESRRLSEDVVITEPMAAADFTGVCANGSAVNSTSIGLVRQRYGMPSSGGDPNISQWFMTPLAVPHNTTDLRAFQKLYAVEPPSNVSAQCVTWKGKCFVDGHSLEANLDAQMLTGGSPRTTTVEQYFDLWDMDCDDPSCWLNDVTECAEYECDPATADCSHDPCFGKPPPSVVSLSWGVPEIDLAQDSVYGFNKDAAHLALLGVTLVVSAGDGGAAGIYPEITASQEHADQTVHEGGQDITYYGQQCGNGYQPLFPASSPFVTSVGATQGVEDGKDETGSSAGTGGGITSSGGFSTIEYPRSMMPFQASHLKGYLQSAAGQEATPGYFIHGEHFSSASYDDHDSEAQYITDQAATRRGYPDVAMAGSAVQMVNAGVVQLIDGTSASAPLFASMVSNVVAQRRANGPAVWRTETTHDPLQGVDSNYASVTAADVTHGYRLGWLNPTLYAASPGVFTDVVAGNNTDGRGTVCPLSTDLQNDVSYGLHGIMQNVALGRPAGFGATDGWDPVSGLGSITNDRLAALFPVTVATSQGGGQLGSDYYDQSSEETSAYDQQQNAVPSPPSSYHSYSG